jgi:hypothetical protein
MHRRAFGYTLIAAALAGCMIGALPAEAIKKPKLPFCWGGSCAPDQKEEFNPEGEQLIWKMSHQPELMNIEYLKYFIGRPHNEKQADGTLNPTYIWYDGHEQVKYELEQTHSTPGQVVHSQFTVHLEGQGVSFDKLTALYGQPVKRFYDYHARPAEVYSFVPTTYLAFSSPPNTFRCNEAKIVYSGQPLPLPSPTDIAEAEAAMVARGAMLGNSGELTTEAIPILQARARTRPSDPEAHFHLAEAFRQQNDLNGAIGEYKVALALSGSNQEVREKSLAALRQMRVIDEYDPDQRRKLELVNNGQFLRAAARDKKQQNNAAPPNPPNSL